MVDRDYILAPQVVTVDFALEPVFSSLNSLHMLNQIDDLSGLGEWVLTTYSTMSPDLRQRHELVMNGLGGVLFDAFPPQPHHTTFEGYLDDLAQQDPLRLRNDLYRTFAEDFPRHHTDVAYTPLPSLDEFLKGDGAALVDYIACFKPTTPTMWRDVYALMLKPDAMLALIVDHLRYMWLTAFKAEWARILPMLQESIAAFARIPYQNMTGLEAIRAITGRDMTGKLDTKLDRASHLRFVPSAHLGPYVSKFVRDQTLIIIFGARLPRGSGVSSSDLSRAELLVRLNALADDTRLRILELLTHEAELCAQSIIERIGGLSQSSVSRHLSQLTATGYIVERRREQQKCYSLNPERAFDTIRALTNFLSRS
ncbi:MAG: metalloregulator ArsR/SmtB family transcription factor [Chloroflexota bacterium]|nr:metalloregulator ArsR/SmtB family transcription factor [Chloroflexota bacterium]